MENYTSPTFQGEAFHCPNCNTFAHQIWFTEYHAATGSFSETSGLDSAYCSKCTKYSLWLDEKMIHPRSSNIPMPNPDLYDDVKLDYLEARNIFTDSPRGSAAILRLSIEKLCKELGDENSSLDENIGKLIEERGLSPRIQKALDTVRVIRNNAVHPGRIDLDDSPETAQQMFQLINIIAQQLITDENSVDSLFNDSLSEGEKQHVQDRDS